MFNLFAAYTEYCIDTWQRSILMLDVLNQRGNQHNEEHAKEAPHVINEAFDWEYCIEGDLSNYFLIQFQENLVSEKAPYIIIDPRAGHGPGIGAFKKTSEVSEILRAGHPCYLVGFDQTCSADQNIADVVEDIKMFIETVVEIHDGLCPILIGNCQGGWLAAIVAGESEHVGGLITAGSPMSYWHGQQPMSYTGGFLGGSWMTQAMIDTNNGEFDGTWLVSNFESLNHANTLVKKSYNLYANIDTEVPRYLGFEKWWDQHITLSGKELKWTVDELFVGNKLARGETLFGEVLSYIDCPVICFSSWGDNITPPSQSIGWVLDVFESDDDITQPIIYSIHPSVGHLGIFVSGGVAKTFHREFIKLMSKSLEPGLYELTVNEDGEFDIYPRTLEDVRQIPGINTREQDQMFQNISDISEINNEIYASTIQPMVQTIQVGDFLHQACRAQYTVFSDLNPFMAGIQPLAEIVRKNRKQCSPNNPFKVWEEFIVGVTTNYLDLYQGLRDISISTAVKSYYQSPRVDA